MAVKIRLKKMGSRKKPFYRFVAADVRSPRDGRFIEVLGYYNPLTDPPDVKLDDDKVLKWLNAGAEPTENAAQLLRKAGLLERWQLLKQGVKISELDAVIEERRAKQPSPKPPEEKKAAKKEAAAEKKDEPVGEAPPKAAEKKEKPIEEAPPKAEEKKEEPAEASPEAGENEKPE